MRVRSLGWEDPLEQEMATHACCLENPMDRGAWQATVRRAAELDTTEVSWHARAHTHTHTPTHPFVLLTCVLLTTPF